jgi:hypothetical protein
LTFRWNGIAESVVDIKDIMVHSGLRRIKRLQQPTIFVLVDGL